jgi:hypothetical protein
MPLRHVRWIKANNIRVPLVEADIDLDGTIQHRPEGVPFFPTVIPRHLVFRYWDLGAPAGMARNIPFPAIPFPGSQASKIRPRHPAAPDPGQSLVDSVRPLAKSRMT